jgi:hypothetical protein
MHTLSPAAVRARDLLARTFELPGTDRDLLAVLGEYRAALVAMLIGE